jgi:hypothetical protein
MKSDDVAVTVNEVEALYELYKMLSVSVVKDGLIHKVVTQMNLSTKCSQLSIMLSDLVWILALLSLSRRSSGSPCSGTAEDRISSRTG